MHLTLVTRWGSFGSSDSSVRPSWNPRPSLTAVSCGAVISRPFGLTGLSGHDKAWRRGNARATSLCSPPTCFFICTLCNICCWKMCWRERGRVIFLISLPLYIVSTLIMQTAPAAGDAAYLSTEPLVNYPNLFRFYLMLTVSAIRKYTSRWVYRCMRIQSLQNPLWDSSLRECVTQTLNA